MEEGQSASKSLRELINSYEKGSTTIPKGSRRIIKKLSEMPDIELTKLFDKKRKYSVVSCIYMIITSDIPRIYIGSTNRFNKRMQKHRNGLISGKSVNKFMKHTYDKYGKDIFFVGILEVTDKLEEKELYWIKQFINFDRCFNVTVDTKRNFLDNLFYWSVTESRKKQMKPVLRFDLDGKFIKEYESVTIAAKAVGTSSTNVSGVCNGRIRYIKSSIFVYKDNYKGEEIKIRDRRKGIYKFPKPNSKKVICLTTNKVFNSISETQRFYNFPYTVLSKKLNQAKGETLVYKELEFKFYEDIV